VNNFEYYAPTRICFGKGEISKLPAQILKTGDRVLLAYGGGSVKKIGLYDEVVRLFRENGISYAELGGIEPNPKIESVREGVRICREQKLEAIVAVGGGSTIDCAKAISAAVFYDGDPWDIILDDSKIGQCLPIFDVLTLSATGTEMNGNAVISNMALNDKKALHHENVKPVCSILDPAYTFTVSKFQTASGVADIMSHIFEVYFSNDTGTLVQDRIAEGLLKVCIECGKQAVENPEDYEARANLMWASSLAINGLTAGGKEEAWSCHSMEHQLSAYYDITHGAGLAVLTPAWFRFILSDKTVNKFVDYGVNVWGIDKALDKLDIAVQAIARTEEFFNSLGLPQRLSDFGIDEKYLEEMAQKSADEGMQYAYVPMTKADIIQIYRSCM